MREVLRLLTPEEFGRRQRLMPPWRYLAAAAVVVGSFTAATHGLRSEPVLGLAVLHAGWIVSAILVIHATFRWGQRCGFVVLDQRRGFSPTNLLRNAAMSAVMFLVVMLIASTVLAISLSLWPVGR